MDAASQKAKKKKVATSGGLMSDSELEELARANSLNKVKRVTCQTLVDYLR